MTTNSSYRVFLLSQEGDYGTLHSHLPLVCLFHYAVQVGLAICLALALETSLGLINPYAASTLVTRPKGRAHRLWAVRRTSCILMNLFHWMTI